MSEQKKSERIVFKSLIFILIICVASLMAVGTYSGKMRIERDTAVKQLAEINIELQKQTEASRILKSQVDASDMVIKNMNQVNDKLKKNLLNIKDKDDLIKRDIFLYIDMKYQLIPRTVAMEVAEQIVKFSKQEGISTELIVGMIEVESGFNPMAISKKNARGLMQVMPEWKKKFNLKKVSDLHDIDTNISCGIKILKIHINDDGKGSIDKGLYYYVGKDKNYASRVYESMGRFVAFRSTLDSDKADDSTDPDETEEKEGKDNINETNQILQVQ